MITEKSWGYVMARKAVFNNDKEAVEAAKIIITEFPEGWDFRLRESEIGMKNIKKVYFIEYFNTDAKLVCHQTETKPYEKESKERFTINCHEDQLSAYIGVGETPYEAIKDIRKKIKKDMEVMESILKKIKK